MLDIFVFWRLQFSFPQFGFREIVND
jgi:hypothetical protein